MFLAYNSKFSVDPIIISALTVWEKRTFDEENNDS